MKNANWQTEGNQILIQYWRYKLRGEQEQPEIPIGEEEVVVGWWGLVHCTVGRHFMRSFI